MSSRESRDVVCVRPTRRRNSKELIPPGMSDLRIVLLGRSVSENSRVGNFLLGRAAFDSEPPSDDVEPYSERVRGKHVTVINTPLLLSPDLSLRHLTQGVKECVSLSAPGPHVIVLVLKPDECSREEKVCVEIVLNCFSDSVFEHTLVLTTQEPESTKVNDVMKEILNKCFNRHYRLGTDSTPADLIATFQEIVQGNDGRYLICNKYEDLYFTTEATERDVPQTRSEFLQYSQHFTLDSNTAHKCLRLSEGNRVISGTGTEQPYPDHPDRFDDVPQVLCRESVCGRSYWEIEWSGEYVSISVSYKSICRKGGGKECKFGYNDQSWCLDCTPSRYSFWNNNIRTDLPVKSLSRRIGVYVNHSAGTLSFYSVDRDTMILIHTVHTTFTQLLYPGFWFSKGSVKLC